jgi:hypothetical protein
MIALITTVTKENVTMGILLPRITDVINTNRLGSIKMNTTLMLKREVKTPVNCGRKEACAYCLYGIANKNHKCEYDIFDKGDCSFIDINEYIEQRR